jgi:hypothetical protein
VAGALGTAGLLPIVALLVKPQRGLVAVLDLPPDASKVDNRNHDPTKAGRNSLSSIRQDRRAANACPMCRQSTLRIVTDFMGLLYSQTPTFTVPGPVLTCAVVECANCGFLSLHNLATLGVKS